MTNTNDKQQRAEELKAQVAEQAAHGWITGRNRAFVHEWKELIADQLARGYTWKVIWSALKEMECTVMSYNSFRRHCRAIGLERPDGQGKRVKPGKKGRPPLREPRLLGQRSGAIISRPRTIGEGFVHPNDVDLSKYRKPMTDG